MEFWTNREQYQLYSFMRSAACLYVTLDAKSKYLLYLYNKLMHMQSVFLAYCWGDFWERQSVSPR